MGKKITDKERLDWLLKSDQLYRKPRHWFGECFTTRKEIDTHMIGESRAILAQKSKPGKL